MRSRPSCSRTARPRRRRTRASRASRRRAGRSPRSRAGRSGRPGGRPAARAGGSRPTRAGAAVQAEERQRAGGGLAADAVPGAVPAEVDEAFRQAAGARTSTGRRKKTFSTTAPAERMSLDAARAEPVADARDEPLGRRCARGQPDRLGAGRASARRSRSRPRSGAPRRRRRARSRRGGSSWTSSASRSRAAGRPRPRAP